VWLTEVSKVHKLLLISSVILMSFVAQAQTQVATVTSSAQFTLRGAGITAGTGVPTWPVLAGDTVAAGTALTILTFPDGSVVTLAPGSEGMVGFVDGTPTFQLISGKARYSLKSKKALVLLTPAGAVAVAGLSGTLTLGGVAAATFWTAGTVTAAVVIGGAAAAGLGVGISHAVSGGASVSPIQ